jgi:hypothetical protein
MVKYIIYVFIHLLMMMAAIGFSSVSIAFPDITRDVNSSVILTGWVLSIYLLISSAASVLVGKIAEILGKKKTFLICTGLFTPGSRLSAATPKIINNLLNRMISSAPHLYQHIRIWQRSNKHSLGEVMVLTVTLKSFFHSLPFLGIGQQHCYLNDVIKRGAGLFHEFFDLFQALHSLGFDGSIFLPGFKIMPPAAGGHKQEVATSDDRVNRFGLI